MTLAHAPALTAEWVCWASQLLVWLVVLAFVLGLVVGARLKR